MQRLAAEIDGEHSRADAVIVAQGVDAGIALYARLLAGRSEPAGPREPRRR